ncbi:MAG: hypothetical protein P8Y13_00310 [Deinococcales bacterium]|jgi:hypothetical protein
MIDIRERTWYRRPRPARAGAHRPPVADEPALPPTPRPDFDRLVGLYRRMLELRDRSLAETRVGEDALSLGDVVKATQHFHFSDHYRQRAQQLEAVIQNQLEKLARAYENGSDLAAVALRVAREGLYGSPDVLGRPEFL